MFEKYKKGAFTPFFIKQLNSVFSEFTPTKETKLVLALPGNYRFTYLNKDFLFQEIDEAFKIVCPTTIKILSIKSNENDDHYVEIYISSYK